ncbi:hypothetical protein GGX14DRAFT_559081 [Mycena pura]|uniref:Uncharacterized protein n=1 Tax=Mycena pura TaxID=153505 RepID=A0AAD6YHD5_9AGAR|nr:hypothetical protein GGX14DRAFT_559081 [Mycena pura]
MTPDTLSHLHFCAWLQDPKGVHLPLEPPTVDEDQKGRAIVKTVVRGNKPTAYSLEWLHNSRDAYNAVNASCEIFRWFTILDAARVCRIGAAYMAADDVQTQYRSSKGCLEHPLKPHDWLWTPSSGEGVVSLEIRLLRKPPIVRKIKHPGSALHDLRDSEAKVDLDVEFVDKPVDKPFVTFVFEFKLDFQYEPTLIPVRMRTRSSPLCIRGAQGGTAAENLSDPSDSETDSLFGPSEGAPKQHEDSREARFFLFSCCFINAYNLQSVSTQESATLKRPRNDEADVDTSDAGENEGEDEVDHVINEHKQLEQEEEKTTEEYERERATSRKLLKDLQNKNKARL